MQRAVEPDRSGVLGENWCLAKLALRHVNSISEKGGGNK
jgi:hypothetical protein